MFDKPTTTAEKTRIEYGNIYWRNLRRCAAEKRVAVDQVLPQDYASWLIGIKTTLSKNTWRLYKAASIFGLSQIQEDAIARDGQRDEALHLAILELTAEPQTGAAPKGKHGPSMKKKTVKEDFLDEILAYLESSTAGSWNRRAAIYIRSTIRVGVRPIEWGEATINPPYLVIQNAKHTNGRASGRERWIPISGDGWHEWLIARIESPIYKEEERARFYVAREKAPASLWQSAESEVENQLREIAAWRAENPGEPFQKYTTNIAQAIGRACKALRPKSAKPMSLYTLRHQFLANMKNVLPPVGISELAGHVSQRTAKKSYSKANQGHADFKSAGSQIREDQDTTPEFRKSNPGNDQVNE